MYKRLLVAALAAAASPVSSAPPPSDAVPIEAFAALPVIADPELSPGGSKVAAKVEVSGKQTLIITSLFEPGKQKGIAYDGDLNWWSWVNEDWLIAGIGDTQILYDEEYYITRLIAISGDGSRMIKLGWDKAGLRADDVLWIADDGSPRILLSKHSGPFDYNWYPSVWAMDVSTGKGERVVELVPGVGEWKADGAGNVRLGYVYGQGRTTGLLYRPGSDGKFQRIGLPRDQEKSPPLPTAFRANGSGIAFDDRDGRDAVYELALPSFTVGKKLFGDMRYDVDGIILNRAHNDIDGIRLIDHRPRIEWTNPGLKLIQDGLDKTLGMGRGRITSWSRDRKRLLVEVGDPSQAGSLYYWNTEGDRMKLVGWNSKVLKGRKLSPVKTVEYKARDGTPIEAVLTLPRGKESKALPLIVFPHGGPAARDSEQYDWWAQFLAEQGYAVIQPNYRGSTGYGKAFLELGEGEWGLKMQDDLLDAIGWAADQGIVDPKRVCIVGASYGGYAAMRGAQRDSGKYRCAISYAGVSDLTAMLRYDRKFLLGKRAKGYWTSQARNFNAVSPRFHARDFTAPMLIVHGAKDKRVPIKQSRMMVDALRGAGKAVTFVEHKEGDHFFSRAEDRLSFLKAMKVFLDEHNPS